MSQHPPAKLYDRLLTKQEVQTFIECLEKAILNPQTELQFMNPYTLLVATLLSAQATDVGVNRATNDLFKSVTTPQQMLDLGEEKLIEHIRTIGLFNTKAKNLMKGAQMLVEHHQGEVPQDREALERLPGVGRKTANVVLNVAFGHPTVAVDTHIFRVATRLGLSKAKTPLGVEQDLMQAVPAKYLLDAHHWLILHGRYVCKARNPNCSACILNDLCPHAKNNIL
jgi:endonuclease-3